MMLTRLLPMRMVANSRSGFFSKFSTRSRTCSSSIESISVRLSEKNAISLPELKADKKSPASATMMATSEPRVGAWNVIEACCAAGAAVQMRFNRDDNGSGSKII